MTDLWLVGAVYTWTYKCGVRLIGRGGAGPPEGGARGLPRGTGGGFIMGSWGLL